MREMSHAEARKKMKRAGESMESNDSIPSILAIFAEARMEMG